MRKTTTPLLAPAAIAVAGCALALPASAAATTPPELAPLLAKMKALQVTSERFQGTVTLHARKLTNEFSGLRALTVRLQGEGTFTTPRTATVNTTALGRTTTTRVIGDTVYSLEPKLGAKDGGKPWVAETVKAEPNLGASTPGLAGAGTAPYASYAALLEAAKTAKSLGPATVDGQPVTRFELSGLNVVKLGELNAKTRSDLERKHIVPKASLEVDLNAEGLPIHTAGAISLGKISVDFSADVLAVNFPLSITAPAPTETITVKEALALLKSSTKKK